MGLFGLLGNLFFAAILLVLFRYTRDVFGSIIAFQGQNGPQLTASFGVGFTLMWVSSVLISFSLVVLVLAANEPKTPPGPPETFEEEPEKLSSLDVPKLLTFSSA